MVMMIWLWPFQDFVHLAFRWVGKRSSRFLFCECFWQLDRKPLVKQHSRWVYVVLIDCLRCPKSASNTQLNWSQTKNFGKVCCVATIVFLLHLHCECESKGVFWGVSLCLLVHGLTEKKNIGWMVRGWIHHLRKGVRVVGYLLWSEVFSSLEDHSFISGFFLTLKERLHAKAGLTNAVCL